MIQYFSENSASLSLVAILIALLTMREMVKQRQESYKPRLIFHNVHLFLQKNPNGTPCFLKESPDELRDLYGPMVYLQLKNIGLGSAHDVQIEWIYNQKKFLNLFKQYAESTNLVRVNEHNHVEYLFDTAKKSGYGFLIKESDEEITDISYLTCNDTVNVQIPETLKNYITFVPYLEIVSKGRPRRIDFRSEEVQIRFRYLDIGGKKRHQKLRTSIMIYAFEKEDHNANYGVGSINFSTRR